jgi:hypothetical protein
VFQTHRFAFAHPELRVRSAYIFGQPFFIAPILSGRSLPLDHQRIAGTAIGTDLGAVMDPKHFALMIAGKANDPKARPAVRCPVRSKRAPKTPAEARKLPRARCRCDVASGRKGGSFIRKASADCSQWQLGGYHFASVWTIRNSVSVFRNEHVVLK